MDKKIILEVKDINKSFENEKNKQIVLRNVSLNVEEGQILCILGYSGCGKTTLLRIIAALEKPDSGEIWIDGNKHDTPSKEALLLFQDFNQLFPWKTVLGNVVHALRTTNKKLDRKTAIEEAEKVLNEVRLYQFRNRYPHQLSGGMKQRAAVARVIALKPRILLMDEPFASLDMVTRHNLQKLVREKCQKYGITVIFVTHGVEEAVLTGDKIVVMKANPGEIAQVLENNYHATGNSVDKMQIMSIIMENLEAQMEQEIEENAD